MPRSSCWPGTWSTPSLAVPSQPGGRWTLRAWLVAADLPTVVAELQGAAWFNRLRLLAEEFGADVLAGLFVGLGLPSHPLRPGTTHSPSAVPYVERESSRPMSLPRGPIPPQPFPTSRNRDGQEARCSMTDALPHGEMLTSLSAPRIATVFKQLIDIGVRFKLRDEIYIRRWGPSGSATCWYAIFPRSRPPCRTSSRTSCTRYYRCARTRTARTSLASVTPATIRQQSRAVCWGCSPSRTSSTRASTPRARRSSRSPSCGGCANSSAIPTFRCRM